jgi:dCTP deaminase
MILSDRAILYRMGLKKDGQTPRPLYSPPQGTDQPIVIEPFDINALQGASYDLKLAPGIITDDGRTQTLNLLDKDTPLVPPRGACLCSTVEYVRVPHDCVARVEGKSSLGRQFVIIHCTAGWLDPGFAGNITLELVNHHPRHSLLLTPGMFIAQLTFLQLDQPADRIYKGKYQDSIGTVGPR